MLRKRNQANKKPHWANNRVRIRNSVVSFPNAKTKRIAEAVLSNPDESIRKIAERLGFWYSEVYKVAKKYKLKKMRGEVDEERKRRAYRGLKKFIIKHPDKVYSPGWMRRKFGVSSKVGKIILDDVEEELIKTKKNNQTIHIKRTPTRAEGRAIIDFEERQIEEVLRRDWKTHLGKFAKKLNRPRGTIRRRAAEIRRKKGLPPGWRGPN